MSARTTRQEARARATKIFMDSLDRMIPADEAVPLKGSTFRDWEDQTEEVVRQLAPTLLEERSSLEDNALAETGGHCPHCGSDRVYLNKGQSELELISPHGPVNLAKQHCRCRACGGVFSPSGS